MKPIHNPEGAKAAVALVTLASSLRGNPDRYADELHKLTQQYVMELSSGELMLMVHTLIILASADSDTGVIQFLAQQLEANS
jgi:hypothetical protein